MKTPSPRARRLLLEGGAVAALSVLAYAGSLANGFVYDDHLAILGNRWLREPGGLAEIFSHHLWAFDPSLGGSNMYRPLIHVLNWLLIRVGSAAPWPFHLANLLLHAAASVLVWSVLRDARERTGEASPGAPDLLPPAAAALFAVHPVHVEAVAWAAGTADVLAAALLFSSLLLLERADRPNPCPPLLRLGSYLAFFLALLSKEVALVWPVVLAGYDGLTRRLPRTALLRAAVSRYLPFLLVTAAYLALRTHALGGFAPDRYDIPAPADVRLHAALQAAAWYVRRAVLPIGYSFYTDLPLAGPSALPASAAALFVLLASVGLWSFGALRSRLMAWAALLAAATLLPVFYGFAMMTSVADRYLYLPSVGFCAALVWWAEVLVRKVPGGKAVAAAVLAAVLLGFGATTARRSGVFRDDLALWSHTVAASPRNALARAQLAETLLDRGSFEEAAREAAAAADLGYGAPSTFWTLGLARLRLGQTAAAVAALRRAVAADPASAHARLLLGEALSEAGSFSEAVGPFTEAVRLEPGNARAHHGLGAALEAAGLLAQAAVAYETAAALAPDNPAWEQDRARVARLLRREGEP